MRHAALVLLVLLVLLGLAGCSRVGGGGGGGGSGEAERPVGATDALEAQRAAVREAAAGLAGAVLAAVDGRVVGSGGTYEGCVSAFNEEFASLRYTATVRVAGGPDRQLASLAGKHATDDVAVSLRAVPDGGAGGDWLVRAAGAECVDVPEGDRDRWLGRADPDGAIL